MHTHHFAFIAVEIQVFITVYIPKWITPRALNTVKKTLNIQYLPPLSVCP